MPTKREREEHEALHLPYRSWCKHCVRGRGRNRPHGSAINKDPEDEEAKENRVPRIGMDYFFVSQEDEKEAGNL
eukprot:13417606-Heterocapsa_arctica.AAC.1